MFLIRNATPRDLEGVYALAKVLDSYNLPADRKFLREFLQIVQHSFSGEIKSPELARYFFLAEEQPHSKIVGSSLIVAKHGTRRDPHLAFKIGQEICQSRSLKKRVSHQYLELTMDQDGPTELGGLAVLPPYRKSAERIGLRLSWIRFLYIAAHPERFQKRFLAEYLPPFPRPGYSPVWENIGKKFTGLSYHLADRLSSCNKEFILSLFPKEKIYMDFLPSQVCGVIGQVGEGAQRAVKMLAAIGFKYLKQVDLFDGGPHYGAHWRQIRLFRRFRNTLASQIKSPKALFLHETEKGSIQGGLGREGLHYWGIADQEPVTWVTFPR